MNLQNITFRYHNHNNVIGCYILISRLMGIKYRQQVYTTSIENKMSETSYRVYSQVSNACDLSHVLEYFDSWS